MSTERQKEEKSESLDKRLRKTLDIGTKGIVEKFIQLKDWIKICLFF